MFTGLTMLLSIMVKTQEHPLLEHFVEMLFLILIPLLEGGLQWNSCLMLAIRIKDLKCLTLAKSLAKTREALNFAITRKRMGSAIRNGSGRNVRRLVENAEAKYFFPNKHLFTINLMHISLIRM